MWTATLALVLLLALASPLLSSAQSLSATDPGQSDRQLTSGAELIEQKFPNNRVVSASEAENRIVSTLLPIRGSVITVAGQARTQRS